MVYRGPTERRVGRNSKPTDLYDDEFRPFDVSINGSDYPNLTAACASPAYLCQSRTISKSTECKAVFTVGVAKLLLPHFPLELMSAFFDDKS